MGKNHSFYEHQGMRVNFRGKSIDVIVKQISGTSDNKRALLKIEEKNNPSSKITLNDRKTYKLLKNEDVYVSVCMKQKNKDKIALNFSAPQEYIFEPFSAKKYMRTRDK